MRREKLKWWPHESESTDARHGDGVVRSSDEGSVMELERRDHIVRLLFSRTTSNGRILLDKVKPFSISKWLVWDAFKKVKANHGTAGVDGQLIEEFESDLRGNLYKLWNRMSSGSYIPPPVRRVEIPKSGGGKRLLGIPTVIANCT